MELYPSQADLHKQDQIAQLEQRNARLRTEVSDLERLLRTLNKQRSSLTTVSLGDRDPLEVAGVSGSQEVYLSVKKTSLRRL